MERIKNAVKEYLKQHAISDDAKILCALSGGADSVALFLALVSLREEGKYTLTACHVHHGLRENAEGDAIFVQELCARYGVPCEIVHVDVKKRVAETGMSVEEAARELRYHAFAETMDASTYVALAHHANDQAETMLLNMSRGTGIKGAAGMPDRREYFIRPLLKVTKKTICDALRGAGQSWREDESNEDVQYARNRIRKEVLPALEKVNGAAVSHLLSLSEELTETEEYLQEETDRIYAACMQGQILRTEFLKKYPKLFWKRVCRKALCESAGKSKDLGREHIASIMGLMELQVGKELSLPYGVTVKRVYEGLSFEKDVKEEKEPSYCLPLKEGVNIFPGGRCLLRRIEDFSWENRESILGKTSISQCQYFDGDIVSGSLVLRQMQEGDKIEIAKEKHQSLAQLFINEKVSSNRRGSLPLLCTGGLVLWAVGVRRSVTGYLSEKTKTVLEIQFLE